jgi:hypothetical protein
VTGGEAEWEVWVGEEVKAEMVNEEAMGLGALVFPIQMWVMVGEVAMLVQAEMEG